ncbi:MAG: hypothetical protein HS130_01090 [Deltaproteobacteria bacterium]|nr:hypothetical protein [Deltaproteobacteria bacterium]MCL4873818.1 hypothetical protein [bacterium]
MKRKDSAMFKKPSQAYKLVHGFEQLSKDQKKHLLVILEVFLLAKETDISPPT